MERVYKKIKDDVGTFKLSTKGELGGPHTPPSEHQLAPCFGRKCVWSGGVFCEMQSPGFFGRKP